MSNIKTNRIRTLRIALYPNILSIAETENRNNDIIVYIDKVNNKALNIDFFNFIIPPYQLNKAHQ